MNTATTTRESAAGSALLPSQKLTADQAATARCFAKLTGSRLDRALYEHELTQGEAVHKVVVKAMRAEKAAMRGAA